MTLTNQGKCEGFFRIPQVAQFLSYAYLNLNDREIAEIPMLLADSGGLSGLLQELLPRFEAMGKKLIAMHKAEMNLIECSKDSNSVRSVRRTRQFGVKRKVSADVRSAQGRRKRHKI